MIVCGNSKCYTPRPVRAAPEKGKPMFSRSHKPAATALELHATVDDVLNATGVHPFDLRSAFEFSVVSRPEGGDDDDKDDDDQGTDNGDGGNDDDDASGDDGDTGDALKDPEKKRLHDEAAKYRNERNTLKQELSELQKKQRELEDAEKTELQKAQRDLEEVTKRADTAEAKLADANVELAFFKCGVAGQFRDPADALRFMDLKDIKVDDDGKVPTKDIKKAAEDLLKEKPYLGRGDDDDSGDKGGSTQASGRQTNGRKGDQDADKAALAKKYPALQGRG